MELTSTSSALGAGEYGGGRRSGSWEAGGSPSSGAGAGGADHERDDNVPLIVPPQRRAPDVRMHVAGTVVDNQVRGRTANNLRFGTIAVAVYNIPQFIASLVVLWLAEDSDGCTKPIRTWVIVSAIRLALEVVCTAATYKLSVSFAEGRREESGVVRSLACLRRPVDLLSRAWFVVGNLWIFNAGDCPRPLFNMALSILVLQYFLLLLPCILLIILLPMAFCCLPVFLRLTQRLQGPVPGRGATQQQLQQLPVVKYRDGLLSSSQTTCAICLCDYEDGEELRPLPCTGHHYFHKSCIDDWLVVNATCPHCRDHLPSASGGSGGGSGGASAPRASGAPSAPRDGSAVATAAVGASGGRGALEVGGGGEATSRASAPPSPSAPPAPVTGLAYSLQPGTAPSSASAVRLSDVSPSLL